MQQFILRALPRNRRRPHHHHHQSRRTLVDLASITWVRDRGLDHAVEKEKNLKPILNLKNFIKSEPSKSVPLSIIADKRGPLGIPLRPIEFIRSYPSVFEEFLPGGIGIHPHVKLTPEALDLDAEEQLIYQSDSYKQQAANRLLKLLMIAKINKIPLRIVDRLKWDLGLAQDYTTTLVPEFPDYFQVTGGNDSSLELVCWSKDLAVSVMEKKAMSVGEEGFEKRMPLAFPLHHSRGFEMDKKYKKWVDEWQKLPYITPYENASHLPPTSDESDKWAVSVMHELLHLFVPKKTDRDNLLHLGEYLGLRSRFKRALLHHPGIFYLSSKIWTHTVVLKEAYKRDLLTETHPLMGMRYKYIHLMNMVKENKKSKSVQNGRKQKSSNDDDSKGGEVEDGASGGERDGESEDMSGSEVEDESNADDDYEDEEEEARTNAHENVETIRGRTARTSNFEGRPRRSNGENPNRTNKKNSSEFSRGAEYGGSHNVHDRFSDRSDVMRTRGRSSGENPNRTDRNNLPKYSKGAEYCGSHNVHERSSDRSDVLRTRGRSIGENPIRTNRNNQPKFSKGAGYRGSHIVDERSSDRSDVPRTRGRSIGENSTRTNRNKESKFSKGAEYRGSQTAHERSTGRSDSPRTRGRFKPDRRASVQ